MTTARIAAILIIALALFTSGARSADLSITFDPNDTVNVAEGARDTVTITFDETTSNSAPIVLYVDTTNFCSASLDTTTHGLNKTVVVKIFIAPGYFDSGNNYGIRFNAYDRNLADTTLALHINVSNTPQPPVFLNLPDTLYISEGESNIFQAVAFDADHNIRSYRISPANINWVRIDSLTALISIGPVPDTTTDWRDPQLPLEFNITVTDSTSLTDNKTLTVIVSNVDRPPHFTNPSRDTLLTAFQAVPGTFTFRAVDPDSAEGDSATVIDADHIVDSLGARGWSISFDRPVLSFTAPGNINGLVSQTGYRFIATRRIGAPADTVAINFNVLDNIPPGAVSSFNGDNTGMAFGDIRLTWNAPHEDGNSGGAVNSYIIRYSSQNPGVDTAAWWNAANPVSEQTPVPALPGLPQSLMVHGYIEYHNYWFAIKSIDLSGNISPAAFAGAIESRHQPPVITLLGQIPDVVKADSLLLFGGVASDSGGIVSEISYMAGSGSWGNAIIDSTRDSSSVFIRKYFHFTQSSGSRDSLLIRIRAHDFQDSTITQRYVFIDHIRPARPIVQSTPQDSLTNENNFQFTGSKDIDATIWLIMSIGSNSGSPIRITQPDDHLTSWNHAEVVYYQGAVSFAFYATDPAGNISDTTRLNFWLVLSQEPPNIIDTNSVNYHNSTIFNPQHSSFNLTFHYPSISYFSLTILNRLGTTVYAIDDSLAVAPDDYQTGWNGIMNRGPDAGSLAPDGSYLVRFSARVYPVSPYDIPIETDLILDSNAPYEVDFFPRTGASISEPRSINNATMLSLVVGDTGTVGYDTRAEIIAPYLLFGESNRITMVKSDTASNLWIADLSISPLDGGTYQMTLVISDAAGNENRYTKYFKVTSDNTISDFLNYPNPFAPSVEQTNISYVLGRAVNSLTLEIFDNSGNVVYRQSLDGAFLTPAAHEISWDGKSLWGKLLNNGVYYARLTGDIETKFMKIAIVDR
jgi:hypothetical protein